jgi:hypothetical protein
MKLMWDAIGTEFGGRHELYERNYFGNHESIRFETLHGRGPHRRERTIQGFAEQCMAEYDLTGWTVPDLINPDDVSAIINAAEFGLIDPWSMRAPFVRPSDSSRPACTIITIEIDGASAH